MRGWGETTIPHYFHTVESRACRLAIDTFLRIQYKSSYA